MSVFDKDITSSSLLDFLNAFTVIPIRVLVNSSRSTGNFCNILSNSIACSCPYNKNISINIKDTCNNITQKYKQHTFGVYIMRQIYCIMQLILFQIIINDRFVLIHCNVLTVIRSSVVLLSLTSKHTQSTSISGIIYSNGNLFLTIT